MRRRLVEDPRVSAWVVLFLGTGVTIAANILHAQPHVWQRALSGSIPLILLFTAHTAAYTGSWLVRCTMLPVAVFAFFISYDHMNALAMQYGETYEVAKVYPLAVDGALLVATLCLATSRPAGTNRNAGTEQNVLVLAPEQNGTEQNAEPEQPVLVVPERLALPEQNGTEQNADAVSSEYRPEQNGTPTRRSQNDRDALSVLEAAFGQDAPATREAVAALKEAFGTCGVSRAERLVKLKYGDVGNEART